MGVLSALGILKDGVINAQAYELLERNYDLVERNNAALERSNGMLLKEKDELKKLVISLQKQLDEYKERLDEQSTKDAEFMPIEAQILMLQTMASLNDEGGVDGIPVERLAEAVDGNVTKAKHLLNELKAHKLANTVDLGACWSIYDEGRSFLVQNDRVYARLSQSISGS